MAPQTRRESTRAARPSKVCGTCGRRFEWRRAYERVWDEVRYCSAACRRRRPGRFDRRLEAEILTLLERRAGASICPSEVAQRMADGEWRPLMEPVRRAARRLAAEGRVRITQRGRPVDPSAASGPIRITLS